MDFAAILSITSAMTRRRTSYVVYPWTEWI